MAERAEVCSAFEGCCMPLALLLVRPSGEPAEKLRRVGSRGWSERGCSRCSLTIEIHVYHLRKHSVRKSKFILEGMFKINGMRLQTKVRTIGKIDMRNTIKQNTY